jgi:hippurate hydrolase
MDDIAKRIATYQSDLIAFRQDLHRHPELAFKESRTSQKVADELHRLGYKVTTEVGLTGVVGSITNGSGNRAIAIRADMDALPIHETTGLAYASTTPGKMHACGHDGHTTMLLGLARWLSETRSFNGTVHLIFQPAEEDVGDGGMSGAKRMLKEDLFKRFPADQVFAVHNLPGREVGQVEVRAGAATAAVDVFNVTITGVGGHGAMPSLTIDPIVATASLVMALQTIVSRTNTPSEPAVLTVGALNGGNMATAIPESVHLKCALRTTSMQGRTVLLNRIRDLIHAHATSFGCTARIDLNEDDVYPVSMNDAGAAGLVRDVALSLGQPQNIVDLKAPIMFSEDFAFMLENVPGCFFTIGNGNSNNLHDAGYDFNDELLQKGTEFWARLVAKTLPA